MKSLTDKTTWKAKMACVAAAASGLGVSAFSSMYVAMAANGTTTGTLDSIATNFEAFAEAIYDKILIIAPILAGLIIAILLVIYMMSDEKDAEKIKKRCIKVGVVMIVILLVPVILRVVQEFGKSVLPSDISGLGDIADGAGN